MLFRSTNVSQFDAIARVLALKSECGISRDGFDKMLTVFCSLLPEGHILPKSMYEAQKLLRNLKMPYEKIHACLKGCILFRKEYADANYCTKCKSSRWLEVDSGDGQKKQLKNPRENHTVPSIHTENPTSVHDRGVSITDAMAQKRQTLPS